MGENHSILKHAMKILVTDGDYKHTLGIVRSLGRQGHHVSVLARGPRELATRSRFCSSVEFAPNLTMENYREIILQILTRSRYDLLMPVGYASTLALARNKDEITSLTRMEMAEASQIEFAADKRRIQEFALKIELHAPATIYPESFEEAQDWSNKLDYPLVLKPVNESYPKSIRLVRHRREFARSFESLCRPGRSNSKELPMIQSFIEGYGCGFFALYQNGVCKRVFMHRRIREHPPGGGGSCCAESIYDPVLKEAGMRLLDSMKWHGVAMVEFRYDIRHHEYKLLEVNPKFWGSLDLALAAGADFPRYLCQVANGESLPYSEKYCYPLRFHWPLSGEIQHLFRRPGAIGAMAADFLNPRVKSNISLSDFQPNAQEFLTLLGALQRRVLKG